MPRHLLGVSNPFPVTLQVDRKLVRQRRLGQQGPANAMPPGIKVVAEFRHGPQLGQLVAQPGDLPLGVAAGLDDRPLERRVEVDAARTRVPAARAPRPPSSTADPAGSERRRSASSSSSAPRSIMARRRRSMRWYSAGRGGISARPRRRAGKLDAQRRHGLPGRERAPGRRRRPRRRAAAAGDRSAAAAPPSPGSSPASSA